jgi:hypothetical protein
LVQIPLKENSSDAGKLHVMSKEITWDSWEQEIVLGEVSKVPFNPRILG